MTKNKLAQQRRLNEFPAYKGGDTIVVQGYVMEYLPSHPLANFWGYVHQHRLVAEDKIGRPLVPGVDDVHHKDGCRSNNHPDNLEVMHRTEHRRMHGREMAGANRLRLDRTKVIEALEGKSLKAALKILKCSQMSLWRHFPDLMRARARTSPTSIDDPRDLKRVLQGATDPRVGLMDLAKEVRMSPATVLNICRRHGVPWVRLVRREKGKRTYTQRKDGALPRGYEPTPDETAMILAGAANPKVQMKALMAETGLSYAAILRILRQHKVTWVRYNERPTRRASAIYASLLELDEQPADPQPKP